MGSKPHDGYDFDYIIVGSGFGGSVSALRLTEKGYSVGVIEMGRRWTPDNLPKSNWNLRNWAHYPMLGLRGFFRVSFFRHVIVLHGCAVGGGSITYANTLLVPPEKVWDDGSWAGLNDWKAVMPGHFETAKKMLGVVENKIIAPCDLTLKKMADAQGCGDTWYRTDVGVFFGDEGAEPGKEYPDPYFGGEGPVRNSCIGCGGCMVGCRYNAKNTLDKNYLYLAEKRGAEVIPEMKVVDVVPLNGQADGRDGYEVTAVPPTWRGVGAGIGRKTWRCRGIIFSGSSLGTQDLLFRLKQKGSLPNISDELGKRVRTNAESLIVVRIPGSEENMSDGIAIGSGIHIDENTHIEATRYPAGSDFMGMMLTALTKGRPGWTRPFLWLWVALKIVLRNPFRAARAQFPLGWARETIIFLCMQTIDGYLNLRMKRLWYWPFRKALLSEGDRIPTFIPEANEFAEKGAEVVGGIAGSSTPEIFFNTPTTAHCMGGCGMGADPEYGVIDGKNRVFGYRNMLICDGSMLGANLGVNPSLTITALTEHAMSHVSDKTSIEK